VTIEKAFLELMPSTVTWYKEASVDAYGKRTFSATVNSKRCRVSRSTSITNNANGEDVSEEGTVHFYGTADITVDDKLVLPDGSVRIILSVETRTDATSPLITVVRFGKSSGA